MILCHALSCQLPVIHDRFQFRLIIDVIIVQKY